MAVQLLRGKPVALELSGLARDELAELRDRYEIQPRLAILQVGADRSSIAYRNSIVRTAESVGVQVDVIELGASSPQSVVDREIDQLNSDEAISGIIVLQPLPPQISRVEVADRIHPLKDIDGITTFNAGRLFHDDRDVLAPSTPAGGMALLKYYEIPISGEHAVVIGRSPVVGKPMALMLLAEDATVTVCHSQTSDIASITSRADIVVAATGRPGFITGNMLKPGAVVVDFGVNFDDGRMVGDVEFESVARVASAISPVPGGTGQVTRIVLIRNLLKAARVQAQLKLKLVG